MYRRDELENTRTKKACYIRHVTSGERRTILGLNKDLKAQSNITVERRVRSIGGVDYHYITDIENENVALTETGRETWRTGLYKLIKEENINGNYEGGTGYSMGRSGKQAYEKLTTSQKELNNKFKGLQGKAQSVNKSDSESKITQVGKGIGKTVSKIGVGVKTGTVVTGMSAPLGPFAPLVGFLAGMGASMTFNRVVRTNEEITRQEEQRNSGTTMIGSEIRPLHNLRNLLMRRVRGENEFRRVVEVGGDEEEREGLLGNSGSIIAMSSLTNEIEQAIEYLSEVIENEGENQETRSAADEFLTVFNKLHSSIIALGGENGNTTENVESVVQNLNRLHATIEFASSFI